MNNPYKAILWIVALGLIGWGAWSFMGDGAMEENRIANTAKTSVDEDFSSIDAQMKALETDSASVESGLRDTPTSIE